MKNLWALTTFLAVLGFSGTLLAGERWILKLRQPAAPAQQAIAASVANAGGQTHHSFRLIPATAIELPAPALLTMLANPCFGALVERVEKDAVVAASAQPVAPAKAKPPQPPPQPSQTLGWGVDKIDAELAWSSTRGQGVNVAVIDTGIDPTHPDLAANVKGGVNFVVQKGRLDPNKWADDDGHGTHVAGIIAALDNQIGVVGVAPQASLWSVKVLNKNGMGYVSDVIAGIDWAADHGMKVANLSLGSRSDVQSLHDACDAANSLGVVIVAAAGNSGDGDASTNEVEYPGAYDSVLGVGATNSANTIPTWSSSGPQLDLAAPGVSIVSTYKGGGYQMMSGTSMATPHVAGAAALTIAAHPGINAANVRAILETTADDIAAAGFDNLSGWGLVDAEEAATGVQTHQ